MRIVNRETFLKLPPGTLFMKYSPCVFGDLCIKCETVGTGGVDFYYQNLNEVDCDDSMEGHEMLLRAQYTGESVPLDFEYSTRDGLFEHDQMFAVFEVKDLEQLMARLDKARSDLSEYVVSGN